MKINFKGFVAIVVSTMAISMSVYADRDVKVEVKDMPARAQEFLTAYFQNMPVQTVLTDEARAEFEVQFPMGLDVEFDKNGNWTKVERDMKRWMEEMQKMRGNWQGGQGRMPSGEVRNVLAACRATIGEVGNSEHSNIELGKAGRARWMGHRPIVRGESMNAVDHPHGGRTRGGKNPRSPWGKGEVRTRRPNKASSRLIVRRRPSGKNRK